MIKPKVCILRTDGTNCDEELFYAFEKFGGAPEYVHVNQLRNKSRKLANFQILAMPGGFTYGDDVASGKILAVELVSFLKDQLSEFINRGGLILGICNGFQTLVRTGLLPFGHLGKMEATLAQNTSGHFECRWIKLKVERSPCVFLNPKNFTSEEPILASQRLRRASQSPRRWSASTRGKPKDSFEVGNGVFQLPVNHGEGKFYADAKTIKKIEDENLVVFRYVNENGKLTQLYPANPNGSINAIAGICDPTGRILGLMPHPEKFVDTTQHPNWRRQSTSWRKPHGAFIFEGMTQYVKNA